MRAVILTTSFPSYDGDPSGHFVAAQVAEMREAGWDVTVIHPQPGGAFGWPGVAARLRRRPWRILDAVRFIHRARRDLRACAPVDRIVAHWLVPSAWPIALGMDAPLEVHLHGGDVRLLCRLPARLRHAIVATVVARADRLVFAAHTLRDQLATSLARAAPMLGKSTVRPPALRIDPPDDGQRATRRRELGDDDIKLVALMGRLVRDKRPALAVEAMAGLDLAARLVVVGDGPLDRDLVRHCEARRVDAVLTGKLPHRDALVTLAACDVLLHPSAAEAAPTVVREARALGVPVGATDVGDVARWADIDPGIVVAGSTARALAASLADVLAPR